MALATLSIDIIAKLASLEAGLDKATRLNAKAAADIDAKWKSLSAGATALGAAIGGAFSVAAITQFTRATIDQIDALNDAKDATGASIENLSALEDVARRNGGTMDEVTGILVKFNGVLKEADGKNGVSQALKAIGLDAAELKRLDPAEALRQTAVALSEFADDGNKARIVQELFGKSVKDAAPFLKDLAEQGRLNATVTTEQAEAAEKFNKAMFALNASIGNSSRSLVLDLLPALDQVPARIQSATKAFGGLGAMIAAVFRDPGMLSFSNDPVGGLTRYKEELADVEKTLTKINSGQERTSGLYGADRVGNLTAQRDRLRQIVSFFSGAMGSANDAAGQTNTAELARRGRFSGLLSSGGGGGGGGGAVPSAQRPDLSVPQDLQDVLARLQGTDAAKIQRLNDELSRMAELLFGGSQDPRLVEAMDAARAELEKITDKGKGFVGPEMPGDIAAGRAELAEQNKQLAESIKSLYESTPEGAAERLRKTLEAIKAFEPQNGEQAAQKASAIKVLEDDLKRLEQTGVDVGATLKDALGDSLQDALSGNFDSIGERWKRLLSDMVAQAIAADLVNAITGQGSGGNTANLFSQFAAMFPGFASGGNHAGGFRIVGERGPELEFTGPSRIMNATQTQQVMRGGASKAPVYNINVAAGVGKAELYEAVQRGIQVSKADARQLLKTAGGY